MIYDSNSNRNSVRRRSLLAAVLLSGAGGCLRSPQTDTTASSETSQSDTATPQETSQPDTSTDTPAQSYSGTIALSLDFNTTIAESSLNESITDGRQLALMCYSVALWNDSGDLIGEYDIGGTEDSVTLVGGYYQSEQASTDGDDTFRWFGGTSGETRLELGPFDSPVTPQYAVLVGTPAVDDEITATVSVNGTDTDTVEFGTRGAPERFVLSMQP